MEVDPGREHGGNLDRASHVEEVALLAVRMIALPFLVIGIVLWALVIPVAIVARGLSTHLSRFPPRRRLLAGLGYAAGSRDS